MSFQFQKATKRQARLRMALIGPSGSGKTFTALSIGQHLDGPLALVDTERGSASKYADLFQFDTLDLETFGPLTYVEAIQAAAAAGYGTLVIDSLSHAWMGKGGALEQVDQISKRSQSGNSFAAWRDVTPQHNQLVDAILAAPLHVIATMRAKTEYVIEKDERTGKSSPRKVGLAAVQRDGMEYEFDVVGDLDLDNGLTVSKTRCPQLTGVYVSKPGEDLAVVLRDWLSGEPVPVVDRSALDNVVARLAVLDADTDYTQALDKAAVKDYGRAVAQLAQAQVDEMVARMEKYAAQLGAAQAAQGSAGEPQTGTDGETQQEAVSAPADKSPFQPPRAPRGSKAKATAS